MLFLTSPRLLHATALAACLACCTTAAKAQPLCGTWEPLADGFEGGFATSGPRISEMVAFDDGSGLQLYVAGNFETVVDPVLGPVRAPGLARWDGWTWSAVPGLAGAGNELDGRGTALEVWDDGTGPALYVGGDFENAAGLVANGLARWDGDTWSVLGDPATAGLLGRVLAIQPHDFGDGEELFVGGRFGLPSGEVLSGVYRWDGERWSPAGDNAPRDRAIYELASFDGQLFASGPFFLTSGESTAGIARFDGDTWSVPTGDGQKVFSSEFWPLLPYQLDGRDVLIAGGRFLIEENDRAIANSYAAWDGDRWISLDPGPAQRSFQPIDIEPFDDGSGEALFVGGGAVLRIPDTAVARLKDGELRPVPGLSRVGVFDLYVFDDGSGPALYAGGDFLDFPGGRNLLARWTPGERCTLDLNFDCLLNVFDFVTFQNLFAAGDPAADFDDDGSLTIFDFLAYQTAFAAGCP